jgi:hypothetical protein
MDKETTGHGDPLDAVSRATLQRQGGQAESDEAEDDEFQLPDPLPIDQRVKKHGSGDGVKWIWEGYLPRIALSVLVGLEKLGKTMLLLHLLQAISRKQTEFFGRTLDGGS